MKLLALFAASLFSLAAFAADNSRNCGAGIYCVEEMLCLGRVADTPPQEMNKDYTVEMLTLRSAKSVRKDKSLADTLMMNDTPVGETPNITMEQAKAKADWTVGQYGPPLRVKGDKVTSNWTTIGFSNGLSLTITSSQKLGTHTWDKLSGSEKIQGSTVGDYTVNYECEALVVDAPSLVIDQTATK